MSFFSASLREMLMSLSLNVFPFSLSLYLPVCLFLPLHSHTQRALLCMCVGSTHIHRSAHSSQTRTPQALEVEKWCSQELTWGQTHSGRADVRGIFSANPISCHQLMPFCCEYDIQDKLWFLYLLCMNCFSLGNEVQVYLFSPQKDILWKAARFLIHSP